MVDVAGTALGAISLGISVCDGVVNYCRAWKQQDDDIRELDGLALGLRGVLEELDVRVRSNPALKPAMADKLDACVRRSNDNIDAVLRITAKYGFPSTGNFKDNAKGQLRRLIFPFRRETLADIRNVMMAFQGNLDTLMQCFNIDLVLMQSEHLASGFLSMKSDLQIGESKILSHVRQTGDTVMQSVKNELAQALPSLEHNLTTELKAVGNKVSDGEQLVTIAIQQAETSIIQAVRRDLDQTIPLIEQNITSNFESSLDSRLSRFEDSQQRAIAESNCRLEMKMMQRLALIEDPLPSNRQGTDCPEFSGRLEELIVTPISRTVSIPIQASTIELPRPPTCTCGMKKSAKYFPANSTGFLTVTSNLCNYHDRDCDVWYKSRGTRQININFGLGRLRVSGGVNVLYSPHTWWRGWSIFPGLKFQATVSDDSPAFAILAAFLEGPKRLVIPTEPNFGSMIGVLYGKINSEGGWDMQEEDEDVSRELSECLKGLDKVFRDGLASPSDVNSQGQNLLHVACVYYGMQAVFPNLGNAVRGLIEGLTKRDLDWNQASVAQRTPMDELVGRMDQQSSMYRQDDWEGTLRWAASKGVITAALPKRTPGGFTRDIMGYEITLQTQQRSVAFAKAAGCEMLSLAAIRKDKSLLMSKLETRPYSLQTEQNALGQTALHLAVHWPEGVQIIVDHANEEFINQQDAQGRTALDYAICLNSTESAKILLVAEAKLDIRWFQDPARHWLLQHDMAALLFEVLRYRRHGLRAFAFEKLPLSVTRGISLDPEYMLDTNAKMVLDILDSRGVDVPSKLRELVPHRGTFYHTKRFIELGIPFLQRLGKHGFCNIEADWNGITPVMVLGNASVDAVHPFLMILSFMTSVGVNLYTPIPPSVIMYGESIQPELKTTPLVIHKVTAQLGELAKHKTPDYESKFVQYPRLSEVCQSILFSAVADDSICGCSRNGCLPMSYFVKCCSRRNLSAILRYAKRGCTRPADILAALPPVMPNTGQDVIVDAVFRSLTFERLELTHTCYKFDDQWGLDHYGTPRTLVRMMDQGEIEEVKEEEKSLLDLLDSLVIRFTTAFNSESFGMPLHKFIREAWEYFMDELANGQSGEAVAERKVFQEVSVVWKDKRQFEDEQWW